MLVMAIAACVGSWTLEDGVYAVSGQNAQQRSGDFFPVVSLRDARWTIEDQGDGMWSLQAYAPDGTWVWGRRGVLPEEDGAFRLELDQAPSCGELPGWHEIDIVPLGPERFEGRWDLFEQPSLCDDAGCICTGDVPAVTWALDLIGTRSSDLP
ncbi:MAG: hypothetical protein KC656_05280 [Myxococcales bacterium]|nr:hypothetical protein [Myxococcales bacterium]